MRRRDFVKNMLPLTVAPFMLGGVPLRAMGQSLMTSSFTCDEVSDRALVIIQLHGGNDGLNTLIPLNHYGTYKNLRPIIGVDNVGVRKYLDLDQTLPSNQQIGLHPDLGGIKSLYDDGMVNFVQEVGYPNMNGSHFRGTDIWLTGRDSASMSTQEPSGWWGRYLDHRFPNYPDAFPNPDMEDPPGIEFGSHIISLGFHREIGIPMGITIGNNPSNFASLVSGVGGSLPANFPATEYGEELKYIVDVQRTTNVYASRLETIYNAGSNTAGVVYPDSYHTSTNNNYSNRLAPQLKTVARLLSGGSKTKVFLVRIGGFDTHEDQAIVNKPSFGGHGALLYHLSESIKAFQDDLKGLGLDDRVLTLTISEFGRQVAENGTYGTDHGTTGPMMIVGRGVNGGVTGSNPDLTNLVHNRLVGQQYDYRNVLATVMMDWFGANYGTLDHVEFYEHSANKLDLINNNYIDDQGNSVDFVADPACDPTPDLPPPPPTGGGGGSTNLQDAINLSLNLYPNPAVDRFEVEVSVEKMIPVQARLFDLSGKLLWQEGHNLLVGTHKLQVAVGHLTAGMYIFQLVATSGGKYQNQILGSQKVEVRK
ncbi:MAG: DUF1501 domain-containing protein [Bacteroidota bacterium]